ncbi:hypothetical protein EMIT051CA3_20019 [Pseudomonas chlororaphis]
MPRMPAHAQTRQRFCPVKTNGAASRRRSVDALPLKARNGPLKMIAQGPFPDGKDHSAGR